MSRSDLIQAAFFALSVVMLFASSACIVIGMEGAASFLAAVACYVMLITVYIEVYTRE